ncbi:hypothetical protein [Yersinia frederiksenii]|uniref:hypothetical protein n=1 Tax=Yersinia frederiksenii TaxID=29484 RepID=UPI00209F871B|nr:hypothetical protein [Yersinia frederiksenii]
MDGALSTGALPCTDAVVGVLAAWAVLITPPVSAMARTSVLTLNGAVYLFIRYPCLCLCLCLALRQH